MAVRFGTNDWERIRQTYTAWWNGELDRPIMAYTVFDDYESDEPPAAPVLSMQTCADFSYSARELIERLDYELSALCFLGDAYPRVNMASFGPGVMAAFLGARVENTARTVWFHPPDNLPALKDLHFEFDPDNRWFCRIRDICATGAEFWRGRVLIGMTDLGMGLDILASFLPGDRLLYALYDEPEEVLRVLKELDALWVRYYRELEAAMQPYNPGYSDWAGLYSQTPFYTLQSDFSYMIGTPMFEEFAKPFLANQCRFLARSIYHLDGKGQLAHLDSLLSIEDLDGVQWIPGDGQPDMAHWPEVYRKIRAAGKKVQLFGDPDILTAVAAQTGSAAGIAISADLGWVPDTKEIAARMQDFGV